MRILLNGREIETEASRPEVWETCICCEGRFDVNHLHPDHRKYFGDHPKLCRNCSLCFGAYGRVWTDDLESRIVAAKLSAGRARACSMCGKNFNLVGSFYHREAFRDPLFPGREANPVWGGWFTREALDFLYPNLYTTICPECFQRLFGQNWWPEPDDQVAAVRELGEKIGKLPVRNFPLYIYDFHTKEDIDWFLALLKRLPQPELINPRFGSYFRLLVKSGLLPEGTRRMRLGTWTLAKDGDMCFSLAERDIDDWLYRNKVKHTKEVKYPGSDMRCDWELFGLGKRVFVEYFGLMNQEAYAKKAELKRQMAKDAGIDLVEILPSTDWESLLQRIVQGRE